MIDMRKLKELVKLMVNNDLSEMDLRDTDEQVTIRRQGETIITQPPVAIAPAPAAAAATATAMAAATATPAAIAPALSPVPDFSAPAVTPVVVPLPVLVACDWAKANVGAAARAIAKLNAVSVFLTTIA